jgi:hypothetical protein
MFTIHFRDFDFKVKTENGKQQIFDRVRKKFVVITPEEWVRQHIVHFLIEEKQYPENFISVEHAISVNNMLKRCDIVVYNKAFKPMLIVECKQPDIALAQHIFDQAGRYNLTLQVPFLAITNGTENMVAEIDLLNSNYTFLNNYPEYEALNDASCINL